MTHPPIRVGIVGASGFVGRELSALLANDPRIALCFVQSESRAGTRSMEAALDYEDLTLFAMIERCPHCVCFATPHGIALRDAGAFLAQRIRVIDLSADFRFKDPRVYERTYDTAYTHTGPPPVYGLTEFAGEELESAMLVANPGCYVTASLLAALPIREKIEWAVFDGKSGYSGAGAARAEELSLQTRDDVLPYTLTQHRHAPEIQQFFRQPVFFTPHVLGTFRGMEVTAHLRIAEDHRNEDFLKIFRDAYRDAPCVTIQEDIPQLKNVRDTSRAILGGFSMDDHGRLVIVSALDNLRKGAASQAVQNLHAMFGLPREIPEIPPTRLFPS
ncbi:N-acetyl-gamma-glutamyl-phosphate reductase [Candidatus Peregrinibacteria bacterium]|nr:N-acetyl-gamma-glutamyl-phosphate reductase [Candidatus Peregrinibacteria bacterium]